jgi:uncharacterized membrane protein (DUF4010 family)
VTDSGDSLGLLIAALGGAAVGLERQWSGHAEGPRAHFTWGDSGIWTSAAILGLTDVDALTVSMARGVAGSTSLQVAAVAIAIGVASNTVLKLGVAVVFGSSRFRMIAGGALLMMAVVAIGSIVWLAR